MARRITNNNTTTTQYALNSSLLGITDYPFTFSAWVKVRKFTAVHWLMGFEDIGSGTFPTQALRMIPDSAGAIPWSGLSVTAQDGSGLPGEEEAQVPIGGGTDTFSSSFDGWVFVVGRFQSDSVRDGYAYYVDDDGAVVRSYGSKTSLNTTPGDDDREVDFDGSAMDRFIVGHQDRQSPADWDATIDVLNMMVHDVSLSDANCDALGSGANPLSIDSANRVAFYPCDETGSGDDFVDADGSYDLTTTGSITYVADQPKILVFQALLDTSNKTSKTVNFLDYNDENYAGANVPGLSGKYLATAQHIDNNDGVSLESAVSTEWEIELVEQSLLDTTNKTSWTSSALSAGDYFATAQHIDNNDAVSLESVPDTFTIGGSIAILRRRIEGV